MIQPRPNYGISRIDQAAKKNHGYYVRITHRGRTFQKFFADKASGGKTKALKFAHAHRNALLAKMPRAKQESAAKKQRKILQSDVVGVTHVVSPTEGANYEYWQAIWVDVHGRRRTAKYSIKRYGQETALALASKARKLKTRVPAPVSAKVSK